MFSVKRFAAMVHRAWTRQPRLRQRSKRFASIRRLHLEALEDRHCPSGGYLLVSSYNTDSVLRYDENTGAFVNTFVPSQCGGLREPQGVLFGPDHNLYVSSGSFSNGVLCSTTFIMRASFKTLVILSLFQPNSSLRRRFDTPWPPFSSIRFRRESWSRVTSC